MTTALLVNLHAPADSLNTEHLYADLKGRFDVTVPAGDPVSGFAVACEAALLLLPVWEVNLGFQRRLVKQVAPAVQFSR